MSNLALRVLTAVVALPLVGALVVWREPLGFGVLVLVVAGLALTEYVNLTLAAAPRRLRACVVIVGVGLAAALYLRPELALVWVLAAVVAASTAVLLEPGDITEQHLSGALQTNGLPQLDLLVRTSGEERLSNFLLWEAAYAELARTSRAAPSGGTSSIRRSRPPRPSRAPWVASRPASASCSRGTPRSRPP